MSVLVMALCLTAPALGADNKQVAREAYREGTRLYDLADFQGALAAFKRAYYNFEEPTLLFNIAQCFRQLGQKAEAVRFYKTYLRKVPDPPNDEEVKKLIAALEEAIAQEQRSAPPVGTLPPVEAPKPLVARTAPSPPPLLVTPLPMAPPKKPLYKRWWVWTVAAVAAAGVATAVAVGVTGSQSREQQLPVVRLP